MTCHQHFDTARLALGGEGGRVHLAIKNTIPVIGRGFLEIFMARLARSGDLEYGCQKWLSIAVSISGL